MVEKLSYHDSKNLILFHIHFIYYMTWNEMKRCIYIFWTILQDVNRHVIKALPNSGTKQRNIVFNWSTLFVLLQQNLNNFKITIMSVLALLLFCNFALDLNLNNYVITTSQSKVWSRRWMYVYFNLFYLNLYENIIFIEHNLLLTCKRQI